jgi:predicted enzyme related to lactoylglutathione lyase
MESLLFRITINSNQPENLVQFYSALGFHFSLKKVEKGSKIWIGQLAEIEMEIFGIPESFSARSPSVQFSFRVKNINQIVEKIRPTGVQIMMEPLEVAAGVMCFLMDPDGRSVELLESK